MVNLFTPYNRLWLSSRRTSWGSKDGFTITYLSVEISNFEHVVPYPATVDRMGVINPF